MNARSILEAETPKGFFKMIPSTRIWDGREYFLNLAKISEPWESGEFCPVGIYDNVMQQHDGMYGLVDDVGNAVGYDDNNPATEELYVQGMHAYEGAMREAVKKGVTMGTVDGVAGPRKWRLVYWPHNLGRATAEPVQVYAGKPYGPKAPRDD